jgi:ribosomal small subunit protein bTHX
MGKGDRRTRRGKINAGSYGNSRSHTDKPEAAPAPKAKPKK